MTFDEWSAKKKKEEEEAAAKKAAVLESTFADDDIAPVNQTTTKNGSGLDFFKKGVFEDGYDFGDVTAAILGTTLDIGSGVLKGASKTVEGIADAATYGVAGIADKMGNDDIAKSLRKKARINAVDDAFAESDEILGNFSLLGSTSDAVAEGIGQVGSLILSGGLAGAAGLGALGATAVTSGIMGASSFGSGVSEAYQGGATDEEAMTYGLVKGAVDAGSEMLFGGLGKAVKAVGLSKGLTSFDDVVARKLSEKVTNHVTKSLVQYGVKASAEGVEEVIAGVGSAMAKQATYMSDKELSELLEDENLLEQFVVGAVTSGVAQSGIVPGMSKGSLKESVRTGRDFVSGLTRNEQKVIDKELENRIAEAEKDGKKLTNKEKDKLYDAVVSDMDKGYISTDTIEEVLGGDTYKSYKDLMDSEDALAKEYDDLGKKQNATLAEQTRFHELHEQMKNKDDSQRKDLKSRLSDEVMSLVQRDRLAESYNERSRRGQAFEADVTQYNEKQRDTIQRAIDSGILNNTRRTHEFVNMIAKITADKGVSFDFTNNEKLKGSGFAVDGKTVNGFVTKDGVTLNIDSAKSLNSVVGHEITHVLEGTELYTELQTMLKSYAESKGEYQSRYDALTKLYDGIEGANVDAELTADLVGDYLFTDADFVKSLSVNNKNVFQKIFDEIKYLCKVATTGSKEARELLKVKKVFEDVYRANGKTSDSKDANTQYSLVEDRETIDFLENQDYLTTYKAMVLIDGELYPPMASQNYVEETYTTKSGETKTKRVRKLKNPSVLGKWQQSEERTDLITKMVPPSKKYPDGYGSFDLLKSNGKTTKDVAYNPYEHTSNIVLNDQFAEAYQRPELVTVEYHIPKSELTSGYKAQYAKDPVGLTDWKAGGVAQSLKNTHRDVYLTRWAKPVRVLENSEVAQKYKEILDKEDGIAVPWNVVTPKLREELEKIGVPIDYSDIKAGSTIRSFEAWKRGDYDKKGEKATYSISDSDGNPIDPARISDREFSPQYSLSHNPEIAKGQSDYVLNKKAYITDDELKEAQRVTNAMVDVMTKYSSILPEDKIGKVLTNNGSYDRSVENTTICVRTLAYNEFVDKVQEEIGRPLTQMESFLVSQKLYDIATEPQCLYCYVSLDRKAFNDMLLRYMQDRDTVITKYNNSDKSPAAIEALYEEFLHGRKATKEMKSRFDAWISYVDNGTQLLSLADIATEDRQSVIKADGGILAEQLKDARKYAQSASWSKIQKNYVAYRDEILKLGDRVVKNLNEHYGLRWYSFSDYSAAFIVENMQQITDASIRGLKGLAYTKDTDFAEIFAPSGMNINISVFVNIDKDGNFFIDEKQSANFEKALELRERYPNVGIVATVTNDDALRWAGSQEWSDVIIPFHIVRTGTDVAEYYKWLNYTAESGDTISDKDLWSAYLDSLNLKSENARKKVSKNIYPNEHKNDKTTYLTLCESRGLSPRFARFAGEEWYMKLVNETRLSADESSPLKPIYNQTAAEESFQKFVDKGGYEGGWYNDNVDVDAEARAVADDILAGKKANEVDYGRQDSFAPESLIAQRKTNRQHGRLSLSNEGDQIAPAGNWNVYGEDVALKPTVSETETVDEVAPVDNTDIAPSGVIYNMRDGEKGWGSVYSTAQEALNDAVQYVDQELWEAFGEEIDAAPRNQPMHRDTLVITNALIAVQEDVRQSTITPIQGAQLLSETYKAGGSTALRGLFNPHTGNLYPKYIEQAKQYETVPTETNSSPEDVAPVSDPVPGQFESLTDADAPPATDAPAGEELGTRTRKDLHHDIVEYIRNAFKSNGFDFDEVLKKAKNLSTFATVDNTPQRVMEKALGYKEGQVLADVTVNQVAQNETDGIRWLNSYTDKKNGVLAQISKQYNIKPGSKESAAAQMYAEGFYVNEVNDIIEYGDAELAQDFPDVTVRENIKRLANDPRIRQIYDETLAMINESRARNLYPEIQKLDNYFLHFRAMDDTFSRLGLPFNPNDIRAKDLPTDLNGVTADLKPGQPYFASAMHRTGKRTSFDLLGGLERYLTSAKNQIYHIDDIQTLRALRNYIADIYGQANGLDGLDVLSEEEAQQRIEQVYNSHLSTFAKFLNEEANILAGKTALIDRGLEGIIGRRGITFLNELNKQVGSNMVGYNLSSPLTNFLPVVQTIAKGNKGAFVKAFGQTVASKVSGRNDGFAENSPVMIRRKGADRFYRTAWQKVADPGYVLMGMVDDISTELIARTKYNELVSKGMDELHAHYETDKWVSRLMGDRSLGQMPQLYNSKMLGLVTKFQLEVRNQLDSQFYDTIQEAKTSNEHIQNELTRNAKTAAKVASTFVQLAIAQHLFGKAFESIAGYNPAFDIIEVMLTTFGFDDDEESEDTPLDNVEQGFLALLEDLPYASTFIDGGRIPISSALHIGELVMGEDEWGNEKSRWETLGEIAPYYLLPGGYGQIKKTAQGLAMFSDENPVAGSYTDSGNLRFPVEDTVGNRIRAGIFGQYANENARDYFDNNRSPLKEKQIQEFIDSDLPIRDYWDYRDGLSGLSKLDEKADYISGLDLPIDTKNLFINNIAGRKEPIDMTGYDPDTYSSFEEFEWWKEKPDRYAVAKAVGGYETYKGYSSELYDIKADKDANGKSISGSRKAKVVDYLNGLDIDHGMKLILFKKEYSGDDTYNTKIVEYLNSRKDISYAEMEAILKELGFTVSPDGTITW